MTPSDIRVGHTYQGKGGDAHRRRLVLEIDKSHATTRVLDLAGKDLGTSVLGLWILARWADIDVTAEVAPIQQQAPVTAGQIGLFGQEVTRG